jgi:hypothetical protein
MSAITKCIEEGIFLEGIKCMTLWGWDETSCDAKV